MELSFDTARIHLDRSTFLHVKQGRGTEIICLQGCLWITRDGTAADIELRPGAVYTVPDATRVLVCAFEPSLAQVLKPAAAARRSSPWQGVASTARRARDALGGFKRPGALAG